MRIGICSSHAKLEIQTFCRSREFALPNVFFEKIPEIKKKTMDIDLPTPCYLHAKCTAQLRLRNVKLGGG